MTEQEKMSLLDRLVCATTESTKAHNGMVRRSPESATRIEQAAIQAVAKDWIGRKLTPLELSLIGG